MCFFSLQWLTTFPQVVSRIGHRSPLVQANLEKIIVVVLRMYPLQSVWSMVSVAQSKKDERKKRCLRMLDTVSSLHGASFAPLLPPVRLTSADERVYALISSGLAGSHSIDRRWAHLSGG